MTELSSKLPRASRFSTLGFVGSMAAGVLLTGVLIWRMHCSETNHLQMQFERDAIIRTNLIKAQLDQCLLMVAALRSFYEGSQEVEHNEFSIFAATLVENRKELQVLGWLPRVLRSERAAFEEKMRKVGYAGFQIMDFVTEERLMPATDREEYFPIEFMEPKTGNETKIGINIKSQPIRRMALEQAKDTGHATVTERIHIYQEDKSLGFNIYIPVYREHMPTATVEERRVALQGYAMGVFRMVDAIDKPLELLSREVMQLDLIDCSAPSDRKLLYHREAREKSPITWKTFLLPLAPSYSRKIHYCGREWEMRITADQNYLQDKCNLSYWLILPFGLGFTALLGVFLRTTSSRQATLECMVRDRTKELQKYQDNLLGLVEERSAEIIQTNKKLKQEVAERKQAEERLLDSEIRLRLLLDSTAEAIYGIDLNGNCTFCNQSCLRLLGYQDQDELLGKNMHWLMHHSHSDRTPYPIEECPIFTAFKSGAGMHSDDEVFWRADGTCFPAEFWSFPQRVGTEVIGAVVAFVDITERKNAQETIKQSEERLRAIYESSNDALMLLSKDKFFDCNPAAVKMFGFERKEEIIGLHPGNLGPSTQPDGRDTLLVAEEYIQKAIRQGFEHFEFSFHRKDGMNFPTEVLFSAFEYGGQKVLQATVRDITSRKNAEIELKKLSIAVEQNPATIVITDRNGNIEYVNPRFCQATGYSFEEAIGQNPRLLKSGDKNTPEDYKKLWDTIMSGREWRGEFHNKKKNGELYWEQAMISPIKDELGRITNFLAIKEDITQRKEDEEKLNKALEELANANSELQKANQIKSLFLATMSHEIRTPLNAIIGMSSLLLDTKVDPEQKECAEIVRKSAEILLELINNILDFSKIEAEKVEFDHHPFNLRQCIEEAIELLRPQAREKKLVMALDIAVGIPSIIEGDVTRLRQIVVNLLSNAVKFTDEGKVSASISGEPCLNGEYRLHFEVKDTGLGIPPDRKDRLFQAFSQIDASTNRRFGGTGLGLAISKRLCELMGGKMWVESSGVPGEGSTFHFTIIAKPISQSPVLEMPNRVDMDDEAHSSEPESLRILLAEDNVINQKVALKMLAKLGYRADVASNGLEVLEAVRHIPYDVILMDCQMPEMDGYEATLQVRAMELYGSCQPMQIIAMTAHAMKGDREECLAAGMNDYLSKPVREAELRHALRQCHPAGERDASKPVGKVSESGGKTISAAGDASPNTTSTHNAVQHASSEEELLDMETLQEMADIDIDDVAELVNLYRTQVRECMKDLHAAVAGGKAEDVNRIAHKLAGSSAACGVKAVIVPFRTLEQKGKERDLQEADRLLERIDRLLEASELALTAYIRTL